MSQLIDQTPEAIGAASPTTHGNFIGGEWCESVTARTFESVNPADTRDVVGRFQASNVADAAAAIRAADMALPAWRATPAPKRGEILYRFGALMAEHKPGSTDRLTADGLRKRRIRCPSELGRWRCEPAHQPDRGAPD